MSHLDLLLSVPPGRRSQMSSWSTSSHPPTSPLPLLAASLPSSHLSILHVFYFHSPSHFCHILLELEVLLHLELSDFDEVSLLLAGSCNLLLSAPPNRRRDIAVFQHLSLHQTAEEEI